MKKAMFRGVVLLLALAGFCSLGRESAGGQAKETLLFPKDAFTIETKTVKTSVGDKTVTYRSYKHILYVATPVDKDYQSLNVSVPIKVDNTAVDATNAPILFVIGVGGYMSSNNAGGGSGASRAGQGVPPAGARGTPAGQPGGASPAAGQARGGGAGAANRVSGNADLALAAGYVVVSPGCRGRDNKAPDGTSYGKAPAAIVDLKAAVRYLRRNNGVVPGNVERIVSTGVSAGGALSALLGASGDSPMYDSYLKEIGAADAEDRIYASACFCPIADLEHADGAYEWMYGAVPSKSGLADQKLSKQLKALFAEYQSALNLQGRNGFGTLTADNYGRYLIKYYLVPSANALLKALSDEKRKEYLAKNPWIKWSDDGAAFTFADFVAHVGRMKGLPAFDDFDMKQPEPDLFGTATVEARHFTDFSLRRSAGNPHAEIAGDLKTAVAMMNPMVFIGRNAKGCAGHWWLRQGASDNHTSQTVFANLAASLENRNKNVNARLYWDAGHGANEDPEEFIAWIARISASGL